MYSYTADSPEQAVANVLAYAGRLQGGDFKWTFDNSVDDASSDVNQKLKDALMAYKGSNGEVMEYPSSSSIAQSSSSSSVNQSSSSSNVILSSSSEESSNSSSSEKVESSSSSEGTIGLANVMPAMSREVFYDARSASLVIGTSDVTRLDVVGIDGRRVQIAGLKSVGDARVVDMSSLRAGVYIVRFRTPLGLRTMKFVKN
jgi:pectate lyase